MVSVGANWKKSLRLRAIMLALSHTVKSIAQSYKTQWNHRTILPHIEQSSQNRMPKMKWAITSHKTLIAKWNVAIPINNSNTNTCAHKIVTRQSNTRTTKFFTDNQVQPWATLLMASMFLSSWMILFSLNNLPLMETRRREPTRICPTVPPGRRAHLLPLLPSALRKMKSTAALQLPLVITLPLLHVLPDKWNPLLAWQELLGLFCNLLSALWMLLLAPKCVQAHPNASLLSLILLWMLLMSPKCMSMLMQTTMRMETSMLSTTILSTMAPLFLSSSTTTTTTSTTSALLWQSFLVIGGSQSTTWPPLTSLEDCSHPTWPDNLKPGAMACRLWMWSPLHMPPGLWPCWMIPMMRMLLKSMGWKVFPPIWQLACPLCCGESLGTAWRTWASQTQPSPRICLCFRKTTKWLWPTKLLALWAMCFPVLVKSLPSSTQPDKHWS